MFFFSLIQDGSGERFPLISCTTIFGQPGIKIADKLQIMRQTFKLKNLVDERGTWLKINKQINK